MKKRLTALLTLALCIALVGCGTETANIDTSEATDVVVVDGTTAESTLEPTEAPTSEPTTAPTEVPDETPVPEVTEEPMVDEPVVEPTTTPTSEPTEVPTPEPTKEPEAPKPTEAPKPADTPAPTEPPKPTDPPVAPTNPPAPSEPTPEPPVEEPNYDAPEYWVLVETTTTRTADEHIYEYLYRNSITLAAKTETSRGAHTWYTGPEEKFTAPDGTVRYGCRYICSECGYESGNIDPSTVRDAE